eukprot:jgi/Chrpa1/23398/Chrysochromulina_OHIO_Genome00018863-RA
MPNPNDWPAFGGMRTWEWRSENGPGDTMSVRCSTIRAPLSVGGARSSTLAPARSGLAGSAAWFSAQSSSQYVPALVSSCALNVQRPASLPLWWKHDFTAAAALGRLGHNADAIVAAWRRGGLLSRLLNPKERFDYGHHRSVRAPCPRAPRDAVGNDVGLAPEAKTDESSSSHSVADIKAVLTAASGRSLPLSVVRLPCGQLETSRAIAMMDTRPFDLRHVTSVVDAGESVSITAIARDVFGNEVGANLLGAAILPYGATAKPKTTDTGLGDRF